MTTIAWDGRMIAADGRACRGYEIIDEDVVKYKVSINRTTGKPAVFALAGSAPMIDALISWVYAGENPKEVPPHVGTDWTLLMIVEDIAYQWDKDQPYRHEVRPPYSIGSGREFATGAMLCGATAARAVSVATLRDCYSGGTIRSDVIDELIAKARFEG